MYRYLITSILLFSAGLLSGQGWERVYPGGGGDEANAVALTPDGGFVMAGVYNGSRLHLLKTDADGQLQWSKPFQNINTNFAIGYGITATQDSCYVVAGAADVIGNNTRDFYLAKTDAFGNILWAHNYGSTNFDEESRGIIALPDGGFAVCGFNSNDELVVLRTDALGNQLWLNTYGDPANKEEGLAITLANNGDIVVTGRKVDAPRTYVYVLRLTPTGSLVWENSYGILGVPTDVGRSIVPTADGGFVIVGPTNASPGGSGSLMMKINGDGSFGFNHVYSGVTFNSLTSDRNNGFFVSGFIGNGNQDDLYILHADAAGNTIWQVSVGEGGADGAYSVVATPDGGVAAAGASEFFVDLSGTFESSPYLVKVDGNGVVFTCYVQGKVFHDLNANCQQEPNEPALGNWPLKLSNADQSYTRYIVARQNGSFEMLADTGHYELELYTPNSYWQACDPAMSFNIADFYDTVFVAVPVRLANTCTRNEVEIATPVLRRCADNEYTVRYCNSGTSVSFDTRVEVNFDEYLSVTGSSIPWQSQTGHTYSFNVGTLNPGECKSFTVNAFLDCNNTIAGQTHCVTAHIFPDTFCNTGNWDGSKIYTKAICDNGTVQLLIGRQGGTNPSMNVDFIIGQDILMLTDPQNPIQTDMLINDLDTVYSTPADGHTYRVVVTDIENYNYPGLSFPTSAIEGCGTDSTGGFSTGFYTMFPEDEADAFVASDCQESYETDYDSLYFKRGHPKGYDVAHYVSPQTDLDFLIYFRNSGSDTVTQVIVRDTLSAALDPATVYPGAASHPYNFQVYGNGIVQFTIPAANLLPGGSSANTDGFVSFRVSQKPVQDCDTKIYNTAAIYFDFNAPVLTNETFHTICDRDSFLLTNTNHVLIPGAEVKVYPNPFAESATFEITGIHAQTYSLDMFDIQGRHIFNRVYNTPTFRLLRHHIPPGAYIYRLAADGKPVASGKILAGSN